MHDPAIAFPNGTSLAPHQPGHRHVPRRPSVHREEKFEPGDRNLVFPNRCGSWLTVMVHPYHSELEFAWKPHARRRKSIEAASFSTRDLLTPFFRAAWIPDLRTETVRKIDYDPFVTRIATLTDDGLARTITFLNFAEHQAYAIGCDSFLTLALSPRRAFEIEDGILYERFVERGEDVIAYVLFRGIGDNRVRLLEDGTAVLQVIHHDHLVIGAESTMAEVRETRRRLGGRPLAELVAENEASLAPWLEPGRPSGDSLVARTARFNQRVLLSSMDETGVTPSSFCRLYHLWWLRDSSLIATGLALAGNPILTRIFAPMVLDHPARSSTPDGDEIEEYSMHVGTRWCKREDDGLYYAVHAAFTHWQMTGEEEVFDRRRLARLLAISERYFASRTDPETGLLFSAVIGETPLGDDPFYGGDAVTGEEGVDRTCGHREGRVFRQSASLHLQLWGYNVLKMLEVVLRDHPRHPDPTTADSLALRADHLADAIRDRMRLPEGGYLSQLARLGDGTLLPIREEEEPIHSAARLNNTWSHSTGPFFPDLAEALRCSRDLDRRWPRDRAWSPWNHVIRQLAEFDGPSKSLDDVIAREAAEAWIETLAYPMTGGIHEYEVAPAPDGTPRWRGDPWSLRPNGFACGTFVHAVAASLLQTLPLGLGVRAGSLVDRISCFIHRASRLEIEASGEGREVASWTIDGRAWPATLQIPESALRAGRQVVSIRRGTATGPRLRGSTARLLDCRVEPGHVSLVFRCPVQPDFWVERPCEGIRFLDAAGQPVEARPAELGGDMLGWFRPKALGNLVMIVPTSAP